MFYNINLHLKYIIYTALIWAFPLNSFGKNYINKEKTQKSKFSIDIHQFFLSNYKGARNSYSDSTHQLNFHYPDGRKGIKPWIAPTLLISSGTALHFMDNTKEEVRDFMQNNFSYHGQFDEYAQYAPLASVYLLNLFGVKGKNNFGNRTALIGKSFFLNCLVTLALKKGINETRPNGKSHSFPSGHASKVFTFAHFMHKEYGHINKWYSIGAYSCATTVCILRLSKNAHWISDVLTGAGIGIMSTELIYLTHQYKWDKQYLKQLNIFPFKSGKQKGLALVYNF